MLMYKTSLEEFEPCHCFNRVLPFNDLTLLLCSTKCRLVSLELLDSLVLMLSKEHKSQKTGQGLAEQCLDRCRCKEVSSTIFLFLALCFL